MTEIIWLLTLTLALGLGVLQPAKATILFVGGEDSDFVTLNGAVASTLSGSFSSGYARESIAVPSGACGVNGEPPNNYFMTPVVTASSTVWVHANYVGLANCGNSQTYDVMRLYSPDGYARIAVSKPYNFPEGEYGIYSINQSGTYTQLAAMTAPCFTSGRLVAMDVYVNYAASGEVSLYCNATKVADYTGAVTTNSATQLNQVQFSGQTSINTPNYTYWSEMIVATTNSTSMRLVSLTPTANGNTDNWDTGGVTNINESTLNTTTVNASGTSGELQEYTIPSLPSGTFSVVGVFLNAYSQVGTTGPQHLEGAVRTGGADFVSSSYSPSQSTWGVVSIPFLTNPNTGVAWTTSDLSAAGFNIGFESQN